MADNTNKSNISENEKNDANQSKGKSYKYFNLILIGEETWAKLNTLCKRVKSYPIKSEIITIGRAPDNDL